MSRPGLTRLQYLICFLIVILLGGCAVAAIVRLRSQAELMSCRNNLKQIGLATDNYHDVNDHLPPLTDQSDGSPTGGGLMSVFFCLTPYLEATPMLYRPGRSPPSAYHAHSSVPFTFQNKDGTTGTEYGGAANQFLRRAHRPRRPLGRQTL